MDKDTCVFAGCEEPTNYILTDVSDADTMVLCPRHFLLLCISYIFADMIKGLPEERRIFVAHDGISLAPEGAEIG